MNIKYFIYIGTRLLEVPVTSEVFFSIIDEISNNYLIVKDTYDDDFHSSTTYSFINDYCEKLKVGFVLQTK